MKKNNFNIRKYIEKIKSLTKKLNSFIASNKLLFPFISVFLLCILILFVSNSFAVDVPVETISFTSADLNFEDGEEGAWKVTKSAKWLSKNKARVTYNLTANPSPSDVYTDYILVVDGSLNEHDSNFSSALKTMLTNMFDDGKNRVALIGFNDTASLITDFSYDDTGLNESLDNFLANSRTAKKEISYYSAFSELEVFMNNYEFGSADYVKVVFVTDGKPVIDSPKEVSLYQSLKENYQEISFLAIQYEMGDEVVDSVKNISDEQIVTNKDNVWKILPNIYFGYDYYETFLLSDYFKEPFTVSKVAATNGSASILDDYSIEWNLLDNSSFGAGGTASLTVDLNVSDNYVKGEILAVTDSTIVDYNYNGTAEIFTTNDTPTLATAFNVTYDGNAPDSCTVTNVPSSSLVGVYDIVKPSSVVPKCLGYMFKGWETTTDVNMNSDGTFTMPYKAVTLKATWSKVAVNKSMDGTIQEIATLYNVIKKEATSGGLAKEYTGLHQDSFDNTGTKKIYHYYGTKSANGDSIKDKNNVLFAGKCWQMIRTTDTGGVKMIYNGEADSYGGCGTNRSTHLGYDGITLVNLNGNYYYGTDYNYNSSKLFSLTGDLVQATWSDATSQNLIGKYTCTKTTSSDTCSTLYYILENGTSAGYAYAMKLNGNSHYSQLGNIPFNRVYTSLSSVGYMYNTVYSVKYFAPKNVTVLTQKGFLDDYYFSDTYTYNSSTKRYVLDNPTKVSSATDAIGKYTFSQSTLNSSSSDVYYVVRNVNNTMYVIELTSGETLDDYIQRNTLYYSNSYTESDGYYVPSNPQQITPLNWYDEYVDVEGKYVFKDSNFNSEVLFAYSASKSAYSVFSSNDKYVFGNSFIYSNGTYKLTDTITLWDLNAVNSEVSTHHYTCLNTSGECENINYFISSMYYITLSSGKNVDEVRNEMLFAEDVNKYDSNIKRAIELWYGKYMVDYTDYLEDTIFCNDREISKLGAWNSSGGKLDDKMEFKASSVFNSLACSNITDKFSTKNSVARLKYPVGLLTNPEAQIFGQAFNAIITKQNYWLLSPNYFSEQTSIRAVGRTIANFNLGSSSSASIGVRPVISLKPGTTYVSGDGSMTNPYVVDTSK